MIYVTSGYLIKGDRKPGKGKRGDGGRGDCETMRIEKELPKMKPRVSISYKYLSCDQLLLFQWSGPYEINYILFCNFRLLSGK